MTELSGFSAATPVTPVLSPQALQVPTSKEDVIAQAAQILEGLWGAAEAGLSLNIRIEIINAGGTVYCIIAPLQPNAIDRPVANPGDHLVVDGVRLTPMTDDEFTAKFTIEQ